MNHESHRLSLKNCLLSNEANVMSHKSHRIALETNLVSLDNNLNAAQMLSVRDPADYYVSFLFAYSHKTTQFVTPFVIVTGYFSTQDRIFGFSRDARSFIICLVVVSLVLKLLTFATLYLKRMPRWKATLLGMVLGQWDHHLIVPQVQADGRFASPSRF